MASRLTVVLVSLLVATPVVIYWLWLVTLPARMAKLCPEECRCDTGGYYVNCSRSGLNNTPFLPTNVRVLLLYDNNITSLEKDTFISRGLTELEELWAEGCGLRTIEMGAFNGLTNFIVLSIWGNQISEIKPGTFENMNRLGKLDLGYNRIEQVEFGVFSGLNNLKHIYLAGNKLQYLHPDLFVGLPNLQTLELARNPGLQVPTDRHFISSHSLLRLDIWECNVSSVSVETFANVTALERLDLGYNNLSTVDINILKALPKLSTIFLEGNPLQCDCQLQEVWRWCQDHNIDTVYHGHAPECDTPSDVQGMWWGVLENGQCLHGNVSYHGDYKNTSYSDTPTKRTDVDLRVYQFFLLKRLKAPVFAVPFTFGTTGNVILLIIITCNKHMRTVPNMYILNLVISDMIYLIVLFAEACANSISDTWQYGDFTCNFLPFCRRLSVGLSAYSVALYSIQRYRVTVNPLHFRVSSQSTWRATGAAICGVWIVNALFALPSVLSKRLCHGCDSYGYKTYYQRVVLFELLVSSVLPLFVIAFSYIMSARHLLKSARPISEGPQNPQLNTRTYSARIVLGLTAVFLISYVPYHAYWTYITSYVVSDSVETNVNTNAGHMFDYTEFVSKCLLLINPCLNPVALFCTCRAFRREFKRYLTCRCKANPTATDIELTRRN